MSRHDYPPAPADGFPTPPRTVEGAEGREIHLREVNAPDRDDGAGDDLDAGQDDPAAHQGDLEAVATMYEAFDPSQRAQGVPPVGADRIRSWLAGLLEDGINAVAVHDGDVVGHAVLMPGADVGWELAIFVHQDHQGVGIGTELLRTLLGLGRERGVERVWLTVERWNRAAIALYESVGFEPSDAERFEMGMSMRLADGEA